MARPMPDAPPVMTMLSGRAMMLFDRGRELELTTNRVDGFVVVLLFSDHLLDLNPT